MRKRFMAALFLLAASTAAHAADITGAWESNFGPLEIVGNDDGSYTLAFELLHGTVQGNLGEGDALTGTWVSTNVGPFPSCPSEVDGSPYWGQFDVTFHTPDLFQGYWGFCGDMVEVAEFTGGRIP
jgi:hypothetical protein